jgi:hypothetical protein
MSNTSASKKRAYSPRAGTRGLYCDRRLCGVERWYYEPPDDVMMRLPANILKCVSFICLKEKGSIEKLHFIGTAFFASVLSEMFPQSLAYLYLVTARHNITEAKVEIEKSPKKYHPQLFLRVNTSDGKSKTVELPDGWTFPANKATDLAVMFAERLADADIDYRHIPLACAATDERIRQHGVGIGSEVFVAGLFSLRQGTHRNLPIARQGSIASMPDEPLIDKELRMKYDAYLTEVLSTKGMSGSPVMVQSRTYVMDEDPHCDLLLLGLMKGHFRDELEGYPKDKGDDFHAGLSIVVPAPEILKIINGEKLTREREEEDLKMARERAPVDDSALSSRKPERGRN